MSGAAFSASRVVGEARTFGGGITTGGAAFMGGDGTILSEGQIRENLRVDSTTLHTFSALIAT
jgi:hypothetical protein